MKPRRIKYSGHARRRMAQRGVREQDVEITLLHPDEMCQTPEPSTRYMRTMLDGRTLKVWTNPDPEEDPLFVRSVAWKGEDDE